ncbi:MAG: hypothetical protein AAGI53_04045 [Planctomycetota bacterium]
MSTVAFGSLAEIQIERAPEAVIAAFVDPKQMRRFWYRRSDQGLSQGASSVWSICDTPSEHDFVVRVVLLRPKRELVVEWGESVLYRRTRWYAESIGEGVSILRIEMTGEHNNKSDAHRASLFDTAELNQLAVRAKVWLEQRIAVKP